MDNYKSSQLIGVSISDEVLLMCHNLALLTEKEEVAALLIGQVSELYIYHVNYKVITRIVFVSVDTTRNGDSGPMVFDEPLTSAYGQNPNIT